MVVYDVDVCVLVMGIMASIRRILSIKMLIQPETTTLEFSAKNSASPNFNFLRLLMTV